MQCCRFVLLCCSVTLALWNSHPCAQGGDRPHTWHTDYAVAMEAAQEQTRNLLIVFHEPGPNRAMKAFEEKTLMQKVVSAKLDGFECAWLPVDALIYVDGKPTRILSHPAFTEMQGRQGVAIVDFAHPGTPNYGHVVTVLPFGPGRYLSTKSMEIALTLPPGSLTQRTMIYAVRLHPEAPASTTGKFHPVLASEAESHSRHQAQIRYQGHHAWESRFHRILSRLFMRGNGPREVVAESWPGQPLVDAAKEAVHSWRQSSGHWEAVSAGHDAYGYDIKRGDNGIWYATGIFAGYERHR